MGVIFDKPLLDSVECSVKDKVFTLYELNGGDYWDHLLSAKSFEKIEGETLPGEEQSAQARYDISKDNYQQKLCLIACSLQPNYPDVNLDTLKKELSSMLKTEQVQALYEALEKLMGWKNPNGQAPDDDSSTD